MQRTGTPQAADATLLVPGADLPGKPTLRTLTFTFAHPWLAAADSQLAVTVKSPGAPHATSWPVHWVPSGVAAAGEWNRRGRMLLLPGNAGAMRRPCCVALPPRRLGAQCALERGCEADALSLLTLARRPAAASLWVTPRLESGARPFIPATNSP